MLKFIIGLLWVSYIIALKDIDSDHSQYLRSIPDDSKATQTLHSHVFRESLPELANRDDLTQLNIVRHDLIHEVVFVIKQRNIDELTRLLHDISDPLSAKYGEHMTKAEVRLLTSNPESRDAVVAYLKSNGAFVTSETTGGEYISAKGPISLWEKVFNTKFFVFHQMHENVLVGEIVRAEKYWVPRELNLHVDSVFNIIEAPIVMYGNTPAHKFVPEPPKKTRWASKGNSLPLVTPAKLRSYYNVGNAKGSDASTQAIYASLKQYFSPTDVKNFLNSFAPPARDVIVVRNDSSDAKCILDAGNCAESNLDLEYMMGMSQVSPTTSWYTDAPFHYWLMEVANSTSIPLVLSISYGAEEKFVSDSVHDAFTIEAKKLGLMGVTIFAASGDDGANSRLVRTKGPTSCGYISIFPASNPYVTSVGATAGVESGQPETVCQGDKNQAITSGGGFSVHYAVPPFQTLHVQKYFIAAAALKQSPISGYTTGRGYPDISLAGFNYLTYIGGKNFSVSGTSASCPAVAALFSNINAQRIANGKGALGWINPVLYSNGSLFANDITSGNILCVSTGTCCTQGFYATPGWDPASGLGSVNYQKLADRFYALGQYIPGSAITTGRPSTSPTPSPTLVPVPTAQPTVTPNYITLATFATTGWTQAKTIIVGGSAAGGLLVLLSICILCYWQCRTSPPDRSNVLRTVGAR